MSKPSLLYVKLKYEDADDAISFGPLLLKPTDTFADYPRIVWENWDRTYPSSFRRPSILEYKAWGTSQMETLKP